MAETVFYIIVAILVADYILERILDRLNSKRWTDELPGELEGIYDPERYKKAQRYNRDRQKLSFVTGTLGFVIMLILLFTEGFAWLDELAGNVTTHYILLPLVYFGILGFAADLLSIPFSLYGTFVIEEKYGFNKTTPRIFILDKLKGWLLTIIIGGGLLALIIYIYETTGSWFWLIAWGAIAIFTIFMTMFYSNLIVPLFNKQRPLEEGELRDKIEGFAEEVGFPLKNIYVIDGSKRSTKANAYFTGLGAKKRIVLYDTLMEKHTNDEIVAILAHEIGHYKKKHTTWGTVLSLAQTGLMLFILSVFIDSPALSQALGVGEPSFHIGLVAFGLLYSPISLALGLVMNYISRSNEYAADRFAGKNFRPQPLQEALKKLSVDHLSNLRPHPAYVFFYYSHPPLLKRLKALDRLREAA